MQEFRWILNWSVSDIYSNNGDIIPVRGSGRLIGKCRISIEGNQIIGNFSLDEELNKSLYVLYIIAFPNKANQRFLEGILLTEWYDGIENRARKAEDMQSP